MPPRKRARVSQASTPQPKAPAEVTPAAPDQPEKPDILNDPWTDDEETLLFKSMIRWKPTGIYKHFNMIAIANALSSHGFASSATPHTRIPGIWDKLRTLYDLDALDEREYAYFETEHPFDPDALPADEEEDEAKREWNRDFELPDDQFGELMWARHFPPEDERGSSSPPAIEGLNSTRPIPGVDKRGFSVILGQFDEAEEEDEEEEATPSVKDKGKKTTAGKAVKGRAARSTRSTPADEQVEEEEDEDEESQAGASPAAKGSKKETAKVKPKRKRRR